MAGEKGKGCKKHRDSTEQSNRRDASWKRGQARKEARRKAQEARERANRDRVGLTPWEQAKALRKAQREAARQQEEAA